MPGNKDLRETEDAVEEKGDEEIEINMTDGATS